MAERDPKVLPDEQVIFKLASNKSPSDLTLRSSEWAVITQVDGKRSIVEIAEVLAMASDEAVNLFNGLGISITSISKGRISKLKINFSKLAFKFCWISDLLLATGEFGAAKRTSSINRLMYAEAS